MSTFDLSLFDAFARGAQPPEPLLMIWGVHEGMRGARWILAGSDGAVQETTYHPSAAEPEIRHLGRVGSSEVRKLAQAIVRADPVSHPDADPAHRLTLELRCGDDRLEWVFAVADSSRPELVPMIAAFQHIKQVASAPRPAPAPVDVRIARSMWVLLVVLGLFTCGVGALVLPLTWRRFPRRMDADGLTLRSGRRYSWSELQLRRRVAADRPDLVLGYDLLAPDGSEVRIAPGALVDGADVVAYIEARLD